MIYGGPLRGAIDGGVLRKGYHCEILTGEATMHSHLPIVSQDTKMGRDYLVNQSLESGAAKTTSDLVGGEGLKLMHLPLTAMHLRSPLGGPPRDQGGGCQSTILIPYANTLC